MFSQSRKELARTPCENIYHAVTLASALHPPPLSSPSSPSLQIGVHERSHSWAEGNFGGYESHLSPPPSFQVVSASAEVMTTLSIPSRLCTPPRTHTHTVRHTHTTTTITTHTHILLPRCLGTNAWCGVCLCSHHTRVVCFVFCGCMCEGNCMR